METFVPLWAGALFSPGAAPMTAVDLSAFHELRFYAKGDGRGYRVMVFADTLGPIPAQQKFVAGAEWREYVFPFSAFSNIDGRDVKGVLFSAASGQSTFTFHIDQVRLR